MPVVSFLIFIKRLHALLIRCSTLGGHKKWREKLSLGLHAPLINVDRWTFVRLYILIFMKDA